MVPSAFLSETERLATSIASMVPCSTRTSDDTVLAWAMAVWAVDTKAATAMIPTTRRFICPPRTAIGEGRQSSHAERARGCRGYAARGKGERSSESLGILRFQASRRTEPHPRPPLIAGGRPEMPCSARGGRHARSRLPFDAVVNRGLRRWPYDPAAARVFTKPVRDHLDNRL